MFRTFFMLFSHEVSRMMFEALHFDILFQKTRENVPYICFYVISPRRFTNNFVIEINREYAL